MTMLGHITDPSAPGGLVRREMDEPQAAADEAVVEVRAYAVNRGELRLLGERTDGWMPGQDVAGVVVAPAEDGLGPSAGARVVGLADHGGWSQRVAVSTAQMAQLPDSVTFEQAASLPIAGLTALRALRVGGSLFGRRVLVTGATGGVGSFAIQLARAAGAHVTALVTSGDREADAHDLGAHDVLWDVNDHAGPFHVILESIGGQTTADCLHALAPGGTVVWYGNTSKEPSSLTFRDFAGCPRGRLVGFFVFTAGGSFSEDLATLVRLVDDDVLRPRLGVTRDWADTVAAIDAMRDRSVVGKVVLTI